MRTCPNCKSTRLKGFTYRTMGSTNKFKKFRCEKCGYEYNQDINLLRFFKYGKEE